MVESGRAVVYLLTIMVEPASLRSGIDLPQLKDLEAELSAGASWRRDERRLRAGDLFGTYQIRLTITEDKGVEGGNADERNEMTEALRQLVSNLGADPDRAVTAFSLSGSQSLLYSIFEAEDDGTYLGAVTGRRSG